MTLSTDIRSSEKTLEDYHRELVQLISADHNIIASAIQSNSMDVGHLKRFSNELDELLKSQALKINNQAITNTDAHFKNFSTNYTEALRQCVGTLRTATEAVNVLSKQLTTVIQITSANSKAISELIEYSKNSTEASNKRLELLEKTLLGLAQLQDTKAVK